MASTGEAGKSVEEAGRRFGCWGYWSGFAGLRFYGGNGLSFGLSTDGCYLKIVEMGQVKRFGVLHLILFFRKCYGN
jgi:hypothetical protein